MTKPSLILVAIALALPLSACGGRKQDTQAQAGGEILPGSISDEMLPLDTATSKPPLAPKTAPAEGKEKAEKDSAGADGADAPEGADVDVPAPAEGQ